MNGEFYIGYQKTMPPSISAFLRKRIILLLTAAGIIAMLLVTAQKPFANSAFEFGVVKSFNGIISEHPYPTLILNQPAADRNDVARSRYYLVAPGKHGAQKLLSGHDGHRVRLEGSLIYRDNQNMIEVQPGSIEVVESSADVRGGSVALGGFTLRGEIVDSKCYLGVMKPGNLKPHKSCAIRCISGGIPPVLCVRDESGNAIYVVLAGPDEEPVNEAVLPFVAEPVEITGWIELRDNILIMKMETGSMRRL